MDDDEDVVGLTAAAPHGDVNKWVAPSAARASGAFEAIIHEPRRGAVARARERDDAWLAPETPSPNRGDDVHREDDGESDGLHGLLEMAEEAADETEEDPLDLKRDDAPTPSRIGPEPPHQHHHPGRDDPKLASASTAHAGAKHAWGEDAGAEQPGADAASQHHNNGKKDPAGLQTLKRHQREKRAAAARRPGPETPHAQLAANDWISDAAVLRNKQRVIEARDPRLAPEIEVLARHGGAAASSEQDDLRRDLSTRLRVIRRDVNALSHHVSHIRAGPEYVAELGRLMDGAEKHIVALKETQRGDFDALMREERELTRHVEEFAARVDAWDDDLSDPVWNGTKNAGIKASTSGPPGVCGRRKKVSTTSTPIEPWAREAAAASASPKSSPAKGAGPVRHPPHAGANKPQPTAVTEYDAFMEAHGTTGGWADVDHARWRRCLSRANMNYGAAVLLAAEELAAFGLERREVIRHARWDAEREDLLLKKKAAVARWRSQQREAEEAHREALATEARRKEEAAKAKSAAEAAAARAKEREALREWRERKRVAEEGARLARDTEREVAEEDRAERARTLRRERAEREARNAERTRLRAEAAARARAEAEAAAAALIISAPPASAAERKAERDRLANAALEAAAKRRDAASAKSRELAERKARQVEAARKLAAKRRIAQGRPAEGPEADPGRLTRPTKAHTARVESERDAGSLFNTTPAVQYLQHRATPAWMARG